MSSTMQRLGIGFGAAVLLISMVVLAAYKSIADLTASAGRVTQTYEVLGQMEAVLSSIQIAESEQRAFLLIGDAKALLPYSSALASLDEHLAELGTLIVDNPEQSDRLVNLQILIGERRAALAEVLAIRQEQGLEAAIEQVRIGTGIAEMRQIREDIRTMEQAERQLLAQRRAVSEQQVLATSVVLGLGGALAIGVVLLSFAAVRRDTLGRARAEKALQAANTEMTSQLDELQQRTAELALLSELGQLLQVCSSVGEAYDVLGKFAAPLFPNSSGVIYAFRSSRNALQRVAVWGTDGAPEMLAPESCWAVRRGQNHEITPKNAMPRCAHLPPTFDGVALCVPMLAYGEIVGLMQIQLGAALEAGERREGALVVARRLATALSDQVALAAANLQLRETLHRQAIRDPLTGLYNRRYLEDTLEREVSRAKRSGGEICIIMLDIDHFKRFNDTFGHSAGDALLRDFGALLRRMVRNEDVVGRYGGEEFSIIMPGISLENATERAELLRREIQQLVVQTHGQRLSAISASLGVAGYPRHGASGEQVVRVADAALYRAKRGGRNRVAVADDGEAMPDVAQPVEA